MRILKRGEFLEGMLGIALGIVVECGGPPWQCVNPENTGGI